jgi:hypothetical protein
LASEPNDAFTMVDLVVGELLGRHPAELIIEEVLTQLGDNEDVSEDALSTAIYDLSRDAVKVGRALPGMADLGTPGIELGCEQYLRELAKRARVPQIDGRMQADGMFHEEGAAS